MTAEFEARRHTTNELVLPEGEFAYTRDTTSGVTKVRCGPAVVNAQAQDEPVVFDVESGRFETVSLSQAAQVNVVVPAGSYYVMCNPSEDRSHPETGTGVARGLKVGERVHISGPGSFALWPRQFGEVIEGHQLRSNQYLLVRVYDEKAARKSWASAVIQRASSDDSVAGDHDAEAIVASAGSIPNDLSVGRLLVIRGTEVSFYIPPTGVEVLKRSSGEYAREALSLERLQYCITIDEGGNKRYKRGPDVVFPLPTERFHSNEKGDLTFRPVELNSKIQGIHIKVIADYKDVNGDHGPKGRIYKEGDELFITGETTPIYFPCEQHSAVKYDGKTKHFATAIPAGDGRYLLDRHTGEIDVLTGGSKGQMHMPDPRKHVFVRRALTVSECELLYPGNAEVLDYNTSLQKMQLSTPTTRSNMVSEGEMQRSRKFRTYRTTGSADLTVGDAYFADSMKAGNHSSAEMGGDEFSRAATYTEPRTVTLGGKKFTGVPKINIWTGYAIMVVDTAGERRVELGPKRVLLGFNETLESLRLSTGKPKNTDRLLNTAYLQVNHNKVSDVITAETADGVEVSTKVVLRVDFKGDPKKWFDVPNYVKLLTDHVRSVLKGAIRQVTVEEFFTRSEDFVRDSLLGQKTDDSPRKGMSFEENGMRIYDVEVLSATVGDSTIQNLLKVAQHEVVESNISLARAQRRLSITQKNEEISRLVAEARDETSEHSADLTIKSITRTLTSALAQHDANIEETKKQLEHQTSNDEIHLAATQAEAERKKVASESSLAAHKARQELEIQLLKENTAAAVSQLDAAQSGFSEALLALGNQDTLVKVAEAMSVQQFMGGKDLPDVIQKVFAGTPLEGAMTKVLKVAAAPKNGAAKVVAKSTARRRH